MNNKIILSAIASSLITLSCCSYANEVDGLAAYYSFDNCKFTDTSGNNNNGDSIGNLQCVTGKKGKALYFDGSSYAVIPNSPSLNPDTQWSMAFWIKADDTPSTAYSSLIHKGNKILPNTCFKEREYIIHFTKSLILHTSSAGDNDCHHAANATALTKEKWYHFAVVIDRKQHIIKNYINGKLVNSTADSYTNFNNNESDVYIGSSVEIAAREDLSNFKGTIDDLRFYNKALTDDDVSSLYLVNPAVKVSISGLKDKSVTCRNNTTGQEVTIEDQSGSLQDCRKAGLKTKSNQKVSVIIDGSTY